MKQINFIAATLLMLFTSFGFVLAQEDTGDFGTSDPITNSLEGTIYFLPEGTEALPNFEGLTPVGRVYTQTLNVPSRSFDQGFPGVTGRFEWFAIDYKGTFFIEEAGTYKFRLTSDDGAKLIIDGELLLDNDGKHKPSTVQGSRDLSTGTHQIEVQYFQGPKYFVALVLEVARENGSFEVFSTYHTQTRVDSVITKVVFVEPDPPFEELNPKEILIGESFRVEVKFNNIPPDNPDPVKIRNTSGGDAIPLQLNCPENSVVCRTDPVQVVPTDGESEDIPEIDEREEMPELEL